MLCKPAAIMLPPAAAPLHRVSSYAPIPLNEYRDTGPLSYALLPTLPTEKPDMCFSSRMRTGSSDLYPLPYAWPQWPVPGLVHISVMAAIYILVPINTPQPGALSNNGLVLHPRKLLWFIPFIDLFKDTFMTSIRTFSDSRYAKIFWRPCFFFENDPMVSEDFKRSYTPRSQPTPSF